MWSFYCRYSKWKAGRWQTKVVGKHNVSRNSVAIMSLWLQSLLFCIFCLDCTCAPTSDSLSGIDSLNTKPNFVDLKMAYAPEMQHSVALVHVSKPQIAKRMLKTLKAHSMMEQQALSVSLEKLYKRSRLFKRDLENVSQENSLSELAPAFKKILRKIISQENLSELENNNSVASSNTRSLSSFPGDLLRTGLLNDTSLDHMLTTPSSATVLHSDVSETLTPPLKWDALSEMPTLPHKWDALSEIPTPPQNWSPLSETTLPHKWSSLSETQTPSHKWSTLSEMPTTPQKLDNVLLQMLTLVDAKTSPAVERQMLSTLKHTSFSSPEYMPSTGSSNKQEQTAFPDLRSFLVQSESTSLLTAYSDGKHVAKLISYSNVPGNLFPVTSGTEVLNLITSSGYTNNGLKELTTSDQKTGSYKTGTDKFNLLDTYVHKIFETSTTGLQNSYVPVTKTSPTNLNLDSSTVSVNTEPYSQNSKSSSTLLDFSSYTSLYQRKENPLALTSVTVDHSTDLSHMTMQSIGSSSVEDGTSVGTLFTLSNLAAHVEPDPSAQTILQTSKTDQTSEQGGGLNRQKGTLRTISVSTWPSQTMSTAEVTHSMSFKTPQTDFNTFSSVTPSTFLAKNKACLLQIHDTANTQTPETSSETLKLTSLYKPTDYESDTTVLTSNYEPLNYSSTPVESTYTDVQLGFQSTMTPSFESDPFNDAMNGNGKTNQSTFNLTSTHSSSTVPSTGVSKLLSTFTFLQKSSTSQQSSSTVSSVQKLQTSQSTLYSPETYRVSLSDEASVGQGHTLQQLSTAFTSDGTRPSYVPRTISAALQRTISTKSVADLETSSMKTSTYHTSMKDHLVSKLYSTIHPMTTQQTSSSLRQSRAVMATTVNNLNILTGPLSSVASSNATMKPLLTSTPSSGLASLSQSSKITLPNASSTMQVTPGAKEWIPQTIFPRKPTTYNSRQSVSSATFALVVTMPLNFHLTGVSFNEQLTNRTSDEYKTLEKEVKLVMDKMCFDKYQNSYLTTEIKSFLKGSVIVESNIVFKNNLYMPSVSDIIRTLLTDGTKTNYFEWSINGSTVELNGYKLSNMPLENLPISLLVLRAGYISQKNQGKQSFLDNLQKAVFNAIHTSFPIANVSFSQIRNVYGDLTVRGNLYLNSTVHTNVQSLMSTLLPLVNRSVDFSSIIVNGIGNELKVHSINFRLTNEQFVLNLLDMSSTESQLLGNNLSTVVESVLRDGNLLQVIMREFKSGSVVCRGDLVYRLPAPGSREVLKSFLKSLGSDGILGSSNYKVDSKSIIIGDSSPGPYNEYLDFPGFGVAIIVMCGLCILIFPIVLFVCAKTRMLGHRKKATIQRQHNPGNQSHCFEMDNRAFNAFIEQP